MERLPNLWVPVGAFVFGLIGGVLLDRAIGGPGGLTVGLFVILVPGSLALVGPLGQQYWSNRFSREIANRERFREHADLLLGRVFWTLTTARLTYDVDNYEWQTLGRCEIRVSVDSGQAIPMESLLQWPNARPHLLAEPTVAPLLLDVESRVAAGKAQKEALDNAFAAAISSALRSELGYDVERASPETGWTEWPPNALWYPDSLVSRFRQRRPADAFEVQPISINHSTGEPPTQVIRVSMNGRPVLQVVASLTADPERLRAAYDSVLSNESLRASVVAARAKETSDSPAVARFADAVRTYAESVEASEKQLLGECLGCSHLRPR